MSAKSNPMTPSTGHDPAGTEPVPPPPPSRGPLSRAMTKQAWFFRDQTLPYPHEDPFLRPGCRASPRAPARRAGGPPGPDAVPGHAGGHDRDPPRGGQLARRETRAGSGRGGCDRRRRGGRAGPRRVQPARRRLGGRGRRRSGAARPRLLDRGRLGPRPPARELPRLDRRPRRGRAHRRPGTRGPPGGGHAVGTLRAGRRGLPNGARTGGRPRHGPAGDTPHGRPPHPDHLGAGPLLQHPLPGRRGGPRRPLPDRMRRHGHGPDHALPPASGHRLRKPHLRPSNLRHTRRLLRRHNLRLGRHAGRFADRLHPRRRPAHVSRRRQCRDGLRHRHLAVQHRGRDGRPQRPFPLPPGHPGSRPGRPQPGGVGPAPHRRAGRRPAHGLRRPRTRLPLRRL
ncbi:MAG: hypothetical protein BWZ02_02121 [Lentisphaerae bacterium ADurb.BinA184]|nr:MAG: hypothetical protein BWZ02_02121 [Lentisphaerae bacterium ADurb.BinA184]